MCVTRFGAGDGDRESLRPLETAFEQRPVTEVEVIESPADHTVLAGRALGQEDVVPFHIGFEIIQATGVVDDDLGLRDLNLGIYMLWLFRC